MADTVAIDSDTVNQISLELERCRDLAKIALQRMAMDLEAKSPPSSEDQTLLAVLVERLSSLEQRFDASWQPGAANSL